MTAEGPTLRAVAARAGVAPSTASLIVRGEGRFAAETVARVIEIAADMGYVNSAGLPLVLAPGNTNVAGVVTYTSISATLGDGHSQDVIRGLHSALAEQGIALMLLPPIDSPGFAETLATMPLDIVFLLSSYYDITSVIEITKRRGIALAYLESAGPNAPEPMVGVDDVPPMRELAQHLTLLGHECIATVTMRYSTYPRSGLVSPMPLEDIQNPVTRSRLQGLYDEGLVPTYIFETRSTSRDDAREAVQLLMRMEPQPTAIVCQTDVLAEGAMVGLKELGFDVPGDVSVTGYDGNALPSLAPQRLTSVIQDGVLKGAMLARIGCALRDGDEPPPAVLKTYFSPGTTTASAHRQGNGPTLR